jgi:hypothetical protein
MTDTILNEDALLGMDAAALDAAYASGTLTPVPDGWGSGLALMRPGAPSNALFARFMRYAWQGKTFYAAHGILTNRLTPFGLDDVVAMVYEGQSWFDGKPCLVLDYSKTSVPARFVRDEIREIAPALYLGRAYLFKLFAIYFSLRFGSR